MVVAFLAGVFFVTAVFFAVVVLLDAAFFVADEYFLAAGAGREVVPRLVVGATGLGLTAGRAAGFFEGFTVAFVVTDFLGAGGFYGRRRGKVGK